MAEVARRRILEEFEKVQTQIATNPEIWRKLSFEAHEKLCYELGDDFMDYPELEFWFARFVRGEFELNYERSSDPKARSLIDLPFDTFEKVGEYLELEDRMRLRDVCKDIRDHVDNWDPNVTAFCYFNVNHWNLCHKTRCEPHCLRVIGQNGNNRLSPGFSRNPVSFMMNMLKHPKLRLEKLSIYEDKYWKKLIKQLGESNQKLHVKKIEFPYSRSSKIDLHYMIPGVLEEICVIMKASSFEVVNEFIKSDQCQAAKMVHIVSRTPTSQFPFDALYQGRRFSLRVGERPADALKARFLKNLMEYGDVQKCVLYAERGIIGYFYEPEAKVPNFPSLRRYPIPKTNEFYELEFREKFVCVERKP